MIAIDDFRFFLVRELNRRQAKNAAYSLSAFARDLKMSPQNLSQVLKGLSGLSPQAARDLVIHLNLTHQEREYYFALVESKHARSQIVRDQALERVNSFRSILEAYRLESQVALPLAHWHHWAAYLLVEVKSFEPRLDWIAERLGLPEETCSKIYADLFAADLLKIENGAWVLGQKKLSFAATASSAEIRNFYRQILNKAVETIEDEPVDQRYFRVSMLPLKKEDFESAKRRIEDFAHAVLDEYAVDPNQADRVYAVAIELFPMDKVPGAST